VEPVDVLRALAFGQLALGPRELEVDVGVESLLRPRHRTSVFGAADGIPGPGPAQRLCSSAAAADMRGRGSERM
jgi:hypothetical protein